MPIVDFVRILEIKRYSMNTIKTYANFLKQTENVFKQPLRELNETNLFDWSEWEVNQTQKRGSLNSWSKSRN